MPRRTQSPNVSHIMTTLRFLTLLLISALSLCSCSRRIQCAKVPGTVNVDNSYSIRATELTVREYLEFIASNNYDTKLYPDSILLLTLPFKILIDDLSKQGNFKYFKSHKQTTGVWLQFKKQGSKNETRRIKSIMFMPITAISYDQAKQYCRWLENKFNTMTQRFSVCNVSITLPTPDTYKNLIKNQDSICVSSCVDNCRYNFNFNGINCDNKSITGNELTTNKLVRCDRFKPDSYGIYNLQGNAAEMTSIENVSMGGSYQHSAKQSFNDIQITYKKPEIWLGFRFIVTKNR